jgi:hypothetical protein
MRVEIKRLHQKVGTTIIYVTHDQIEAMTLADRIVIMRDGHIVQIGTPLEVFERPVNSFVATFIGSPPMNLPGNGRQAPRVRLSDGTARFPLPPGTCTRGRGFGRPVWASSADNIMPEGGTGYSYTIGTGGSSVVALLADHLAPRLIGRDPSLHRGRSGATCCSPPMPPASAPSPAWRWRRWTPRCGTGAAAATASRCGAPPAARSSVPVYTTEGGWLHLSPDDLVRESLLAQAAGFKGAKVKVGKPRLAEDLARFAPCARGGRRLRDHGRRQPVLHARRGAAPRAALCRPGHRLVRGAAAGRRPGGHARLAAQATLPIAVGESLYSPAVRRLRAASRPATSCRSTWRAWAASRRG